MTRANYWAAEPNELVVALAITVENTHCEMYHAAEYYARRYDRDDPRVTVWSDLADRAEWWLEQIHRIWPNATSCVHGMSLSLCAGPGHYPPDDQW